MPLKAILFDLDGTLVDTDPIHCEIFAELFAPLGHVVDEEFFRIKISGSRNEDLFKRYYPDLTDAERERKADMKEEMFRERAKTVKQLPNLDKMMAWGRQNGLKIALVTNAPEENVAFILPVLGLQDAFDIKVLAHEVPKGKPDPAVYRAALERLNISADEAIVFEDSGNGIKSAVGAGIFTYGLMTTHSAEELRAAGASMAITGYSDPALWQDLQKRMAR